MKILITILGFLVFSKPYAQELKKYSGDFEDKRDFKGSGYTLGPTYGKATYTYFENENLERIFQGYLQKQKSEQIKY